MTLRSNVCGNPDCSVSTGLCERLTFGSGELNSYGYWERPCYACARDYELRRYKDTNGCVEAVWPLMTGEDFFKWCEGANKLSTFIAKIGCEIIDWSSDDFWVCAGYAVMARRGLIYLNDIENNHIFKDFVNKVNLVMDSKNWNITRFPGENNEW